MSGPLSGAKEALPVWRDREGGRCRVAPSAGQYTNGQPAES
jgi:hypothetical protein